MKSRRKLIEISNGYYLKEGEFLYQKVQKKNSELQVRIELTTLQVLVRML